MDPYASALIFFLVLQVVASVLRVFVRLCLVKNFGWDDVSMLTCLVFACAFDAMIFSIIHLTDLQPVTRIDPNNLLPAIRSILAVETLYIWASIWLKVALGMLLLRVLVAHWQRYTIYITIAICSAYGTAYFFFVLLQCGDPHDFPTKIILGNCLMPAAIDGMSYTHAVLNALADCVLFALPIALLWKADMSRRAKLSVISILGLGSVGGVVSIVRIGYIDTLTRPTITYFVTSKAICLMSACELSVGLTCICLSTLKPILTWWSPRRSYYYSSEQARPDGDIALQQQSKAESGDWHGESRLIHSRDTSAGHQSMGMSEASDGKLSHYHEAAVESSVALASPTDAKFEQRLE